MNLKEKLEEGIFCLFRRCFFCLDLVDNCETYDYRISNWKFRNYLLDLEGVKKYVGITGKI